MSACRLLSFQKMAEGTKIIKIFIKPWYARCPNDYYRGGMVIIAGATTREEVRV
jgi:hypothetical protein